MDKEIIEGNRIIAEFMGYQIKIISDKGIEVFYPSYKDWQYKAWAVNDETVVDITYQFLEKQINNEIINYHDNWSLLIPVIEKIEAIHDDHHGYFGVHIISNTCSIQGTNLWKSIEDVSTYGWVYMSDPNAVFPTKIKSTWYNVIQFINWYNTNLTHG